MTRDAWIDVLENDRAPLALVNTPIGHVPVSAPLVDTVPVERPTFAEDTSGSTLFPDGPPCLQAIEQQGSDGHFTRDLSRAVATYHALTGADDDAVLINTANAMRAIGDPVSVNDAMARARDVRRAADQGRLGFLCSQEPLVSRCHRAQCVRRKFGVEATPAAEKGRIKSAAQMQRDAERLAREDQRKSLAERKIAAEAADLRKRLGGDEAVTLIAYTSDASNTNTRALHFRLRLGIHATIDMPNAEALCSLAKVQYAMMEERRGAEAVLDGVTPKVWKAFVSLLNAERDEQPTSSSADPVEVIREAFVQYFFSNARRPDLDTLDLQGGGWASHIGFAWYRVKDMHEYMRRRGLDLKTREGKLMLRNLDVNNRATVRVNGKVKTMCRVMMEHLNPSGLADVLPTTDEEISHDASHDEEPI